MKTKTQLTDEQQLEEKIASLDGRIKELDWWFLKNMKHRDWNDKINQYWILMANRNDAEARLKKNIGKRLNPDYSRINANPIK